MLAAEIVVGKEQTLHRGMVLNALAVAALEKRFSDFRPVGDVNDVVIGNKFGLVRVKSLSRDGEAIQESSTGHVSPYHSWHCRYFCCYFACEAK